MKIVIVGKHPHEEVCPTKHFFFFIKKNCVGLFLYMRNTEEMSDLTLWMSHGIS